ncbi:MAG: thioredoxin family protein [Methanomassiliicoccales archaeon]
MVSRMEMMDEQTKEKVREILSTQLEGEVTLHVFTSKENCEYCEATKEIASELSDIDNRIVVKNYDLKEDREVAEKMNIGMAPAIVVQADGGSVRYFGIPSGYEFSSLLEDITDASSHKTKIPEEIAEKIRAINEPVHIKVFVTPTCPYCPRAVRTAHQFAMLNSKITADMIEAIEFPELSEKYSVMAVPRIVVNEKVTFEGAVPESEFAEHVLEAVH